MTAGPMPDPCLAKAGELLARRPHFRRELESKLLARGFESDSVERALDRLAREGYLDDLACARDLAAGALRRKGYGPRRVRAELLRRGAPDEVVEEVAGALGGAAEDELARAAAERWLARNRGEAARLARHLERKGFTAGAVRRALDETADRRAR